MICAGCASLHWHRSRHRQVSVIADVKHCEGGYEERNIDFNVGCSAGFAALFGGLAFLTSEIKGTIDHTESDVNGIQSIWLKVDGVMHAFYLDKAIIIGGTKTDLTKICGFILNTKRSREVRWIIFTRPKRFKCQSQNGRKKSHEAWVWFAPNNKRGIAWIAKRWQVSVSKMRRKGFGKKRPP